MGVRVLMGWECSMEVTGGGVMKDTPRSLRDYTWRRFWFFLLSLSLSRHLSSLRVRLFFSFSTLRTLRVEIINL
jgi:hypothetical protein